MDERVVVAAWPFAVTVGDVAANLAAALEGLQRAARAGARLLLLPEKWTTSFTADTDAAMLAASEHALEMVHEQAAALGVIVAGSAAQARPGGRPTNTLHLLGAAGSLRPYDKRMLFSPMHEERQCSRGTGLPAVVDTPAGRLSGVVCYDLRFPEVTRAAFHGGADLLLVPAEWPRSRSSVLELLTRARAAESQCWALSCNRAGALVHDGQTVEFPGVALLADPLGAVAARSEDGALLVGEVDYRAMAALRRQIPCAKDLEAAGLSGCSSPTGRRGGPSAAGGRTA